MAEPAAPLTASRDHKNQVEAFEAMRMSPTAQHAPRRKAKQATLCGVDENEVKGKSIGNGFACVGPLGGEGFEDDDSLEGDGRGGKGGSGAARGSVIVEDGAREQEQVQQASGRRRRQRSRTTPWTFHPVVTSQNRTTLFSLSESKLCGSKEATRGKKSGGERRRHESGMESEEARLETQDF